MAEGRGRVAILGLAILLLALLPPVLIALGEPFYIGVGSRILIFALAAVSLDLILGYGGMVSFGHAAFVGIGAYTVAILGIELPWASHALIAWPAAIAAAAAAAFLIGLVSLRTSGVYFIMITLAFAQMLYFLFVSLEAYGGQDGVALDGRSPLLGWIDLGNPTVFYYAVLAILAAALLICGHIVDSRFGMALRGARDNDRRMQALGFPTYRYRLAAFTIAGAIAGLAGALLANQTEFVSPSFMHWTRSGELIVMVVLGGMGTLIGPVLGAVFFLLLEEILSGWTQHWMIVFGPLLVLVVLFARRGLASPFGGRP